MQLRDVVDEDTRARHRAPAGVLAQDLREHRRVRAVTETRGFGDELVLADDEAGHDVDDVPFRLLLSGEFLGGEQSAHFAGCVGFEHVVVGAGGEGSLVGVVEDGVDFLGDEFFPGDDGYFGGGDDDAFDAGGFVGCGED